MIHRCTILVMHIYHEIGEFSTNLSIGNGAYDVSIGQNSSNLNIVIVVIY
jgi:hypothetical protein